ncbi:Tetratricopeptide TPR_2 repeat protein, partial [Limnospira maxima CS-328]
MTDYQANQLFKQGVSQYHQGDIPAALELWREALTVYQKLGYRQREGATWG